MIFQLCLLAVFVIQLLAWLLGSTRGSSPVKPYVASLIEVTASFFSFFFFLFWEAQWINFMNHDLLFLDMVKIQHHIYSTLIDNKTIQHE